MASVANEPGRVAALLEAARSLVLVSDDGERFVVRIVPASDPLSRRPRFFGWGIVELWRSIPFVIARSLRTLRHDPRWRVQVEAAGAVTPTPIASVADSRAEAAAVAAQYAAEQGWAIAHQQ